MQNKGKELLQELKAHVLSTMKSIPECNPNEPGCSYKKIQDLGGLILDCPEQDNLPPQDGWITWVMLAVLAQEKKVEGLRKGNLLYWRITS